jgi:transposase
MRRPTPGSPTQETTPPEPELRVTIGVDTHTDQHVAVALGPQGQPLGTRTFPSTPHGFAKLLTWASDFGQVEQFGIEGTGSYGAGLTRWLHAHGVVVREVERPKRHDRQGRRRRGKSDPTDAETAARAVQAGTALGQPKAGDGAVEMIRTLRVARRSAVKARTQAINQLHGLVVTAPDSLRASLRHLPLAQLVAVAGSFRPGEQPTTPLAASKLALKSLAVRSQQLTREIGVLDRQLDRLVAAAAPALVAVKGLGSETAGALLVAAGDNPDRLRSEAAFAQLCGVAPLPASSGRTTRHRLSRGGNRDANRALYLLAIGRMSWDQRTRDYVTRRTTEGLSKPEIIRCLKRYIAREIYQLLAKPATPQEPLDNP